MMDSISRADDSTALKSDVVFRRLFLWLRTLSLRLLLRLRKIRLRRITLWADRAG